MKTALLAVAALFVTTQAQASIILGWERPIAEAEMKVMHAEHGYKTIVGAKLTATRKDGSEVRGYTGFKLENEYDSSVEMRKEVLEYTVVSIDRDDCNSTVYHAKLAGQDEIMGARSNLTLVDHSTRTCEDYKPYQWEAHVRTGFGWCGTGDATMEIVGNPEPVASIATVGR